MKLIFRRFVLIASGTEIFRWVSFKFELFLATSRFHCHRSKIHLFCFGIVYVAVSYPRHVRVLMFGYLLYILIRVLEP